MQCNVGKYNSILKKYLVMFNETKENPEIIDAIVDLYELPDDEKKLSFRKQVEDNFERIKFIPYMKVSQAEKYITEHQKGNNEKKKNIKRDLREREKVVKGFKSKILTLDETFCDKGAEKIFKRNRVTSSFATKDEPIEIYIPILGLNNKQEKVIVLHELLHVAEAINHGKILKTGFVTRNGHKSDKNKYEKLCENVHQRNSWKLYDLLEERNVEYLREYPASQRSYNEYEQYNLVTDVFYERFFNDIMQARVGEMKPLLRTVGKKNFNQLAKLTNWNAEILRRFRDNSNTEEIDVEIRKLNAEIVKMDKIICRRDTAIFQKLMRKAKGRTSITDIFEFIQNRIEPINEKITNKATTFSENLKYSNDGNPVAIARRASNKLPYKLPPENGEK